MQGPPYGILIESPWFEPLKKLVPKISFGESEGSARRIVFGHLAALTVIRSSLGVLDQLVFQAVMRDRLAVRDRDNVIKEPEVTQNLVGTGAALVYQPSEKAAFLEINEVILVKLGSVLDFLDGPYTVEPKTVNISQETGQRFSVDLRKID